MPISKWNLWSPKIGRCPFVHPQSQDSLPSFLIPPFLFTHRKPPGEKYSCGELINIFSHNLDDFFSTLNFLRPGIFFHSRLASSVKMDCPPLSLKCSTRTQKAFRHVRLQSQILVHCMQACSHTKSKFTCMHHFCTCRHQSVMPCPCHCGDLEKSIGSPGVTSEEVS
jgi:hypothetical protein